MNMRNLLTLGATLLLCATLFSGCSKDRSRSASGITSPAPSGGASAGTVASLTGDDDSEVSAQTQLLVSQAILLDENDAPLEF